MRTISIINPIPRTKKYERKINPQSINPREKVEFQAETNEAPEKKRITPNRSKTEG